MSIEADEQAKAALAKADANGTSQRCAICGKPYSPFGFGFIQTGVLPRPPLKWACRDHRAEVDALRS